MSEMLRTLSKDVKKMVVKINLSTWLINYSSDVSKSCVQRSMAINVTSEMKNPPKKLQSLQVLPRFRL